MDARVPDHAPATEAQLLRQARRGDQAAFESLYHDHARAVHALALRLTGNAAESEDIVQETFLRMFGFLSGLREDTPLRPWLKRVAANLAIDRLRRQHPAGKEADLAALVDETQLSASDAADAEALLRRLPPLARTVVWLHEMEGWSHEDLARRFGRTASWSKSLLSRSLARLREGLEPHGDVSHDP
ncbi:MULTISPECIES: RNA polymerase sigma factor [unclassified Pseudoxanthomonas]|uniref:RNA polymerase sigma factor n=1 Tax=unclassified Pseudoxanthomonas TaxID=2645906 RepID=UPI0008F1F8D2|nr:MULTISPECIES: RNA polymerase sigma factor [unclassified Pseudoxanthomonas]PPJ43428.1 RNA polymerase sigma factor [Pseudoxanthomonas sp. KAs_5_3]SFV35226.1 RNA polymerase sigma-70 factor, ECF subfamily [Pseudoxanthomonas sp. YR558]